MQSEQFFRLDGPLDAVPAPGQMRSANFRGFSRLARQYGSDGTYILNSRGIDPQLLTDPDNHISCQSMVDLLEHCSRIFDDPLFGLRLGAVQDADVFGCVTALCRAAPNVRRSLECFTEFLPVVHSPDCLLELVEGEDHAELRWDVAADLGINDQANYQGLILCLMMLKTVAGPNFRPSYVQIRNECRTSDIPQIEAVVSAPVHSGAGHNAIGFPVGTLDHCIGTSNKLLFSLVGGYLVRLKDDAGRDIVGRVEGYVRGALPHGSCSIERCASQLGMSVRTLQIRLAERGTQFSDVLNSEREKIAKVFLSDTAMPLEEIAERLGYGEQTSFGRAFKRWTGLTPRSYRRLN